MKDISSLFRMILFSLPMYIRIISLESIKQKIQIQEAKRKSDYTWQHNQYLHN